MSLVTTLTAQHLGRRGQRPKRQWAKNGQGMPQIRPTYKTTQWTRRGEGRSVRQNWGTTLLAAHARPLFFPKKEPRPKKFTKAPASPLGGFHHTCHSFQWPICSCLGYSCLSQAKPKKEGRQHQGASPF